MPRRKVRVPSLAALRNAVLGPPDPRYRGVRRATPPPPPPRTRREPAERSPERPVRVPVPARQRFGGSGATRPYGARETPLSDRDARYGTRNYPPPPRGYKPYNPAN